MTLRRSLCIALSTVAMLAACGGGGGTPATETPVADGPIDVPAPVPVAFAAFGTSADTVSLGWQRPRGSATYAIERKSASGDWVAVANIDARAGTYLDSGLSALTNYSYRLVEVGATRTMLAESSTLTSDELPVTTAAGTALADAVTTTLGSAGGSLKSPDGAIVVNVPAGALAADTQATVQSVTNTAPDGRDNGLKIRIDAAPTAAFTLTLRYDAAQDAEADGQRIAVQRADGSWISLPLIGLDKTARTLTAELPPSLISAAATAQAAAADRTARAFAAHPARPSPAASDGARAADASISNEFVVTRYLAFYLQPKQAKVAVKNSLRLVPIARVRGADSTSEVCGPGPSTTIECVSVPVVNEREMQFLNSKAGYDRRWTVSGVEGGNATVGTVVPSGSVGATFKAPDSKPNPSTVTVSFESRNVKTGRAVTLSAQIEITDDRWVGTMTAVNGPSEAGTTLTAIAHATWEIDEGASSATRKVYRATGDVDVVVTDNNCTVSVSPSNQPVATDPQLVELVVDETQRTYTAHLITFWPATLSAVCGSANASQPTLAGYGWDVSGVLSADGSRIEGKQNDQNGARIEWSFTRPTAGTP